MTARSIDDIIKQAGGRQKVAEVVGLPHGIYKWPIVGISDKYWPALMAMVSDLTPRELYEANRAARGEPAYITQDPPGGPSRSSPGDAAGPVSTAGPVSEGAAP